jgi:ATP-dependent DNA helicase RecG
MHADYFSPACSRIRIFTDHIEFYNPGGLPKPFEELKSKDISLPRNPILAKLFRMVKLAENAGFGFDKMDQNWKEYNKTAPYYQIEFDSVILNFHLETFKTPMEAVEKNAPEKTTEKTTEKILRLIQQDNVVTIKDIADKLSISYHTIDWNIRKLRKVGLLKRIGPDKGGHWQLNKG